MRRSTGSGPGRLACQRRGVHHQRETPRVHVSRAVATCPGTSPAAVFGGVAAAGGERSRCNRRRQGPADGAAAPRRRRATSTSVPRIEPRRAPSGRKPRRRWRKPASAVGRENGERTLTAPKARVQSDVSSSRTRASHCGHVTVIPGEARARSRLSPRAPPRPRGTGNETRDQSSPAFAGTRR